MTGMLVAVVDHIQIDRVEVSCRIFSMDALLMIERLYHNPMRLTLNVQIAIGAALGIAPAII